ncbi:MAG: porin [Gallionella sp.]|nr:porin [Gallionella sp.]
MSKRLNYLIASSLLVSIPALADSANVTVYGVANVSYDFIDAGSTTAGVAGAKINKVSSNASRLGFKGKEELGGGLSAIWQIESLIAMDNTGGTFGTRNTYAGLSSKDYGSLLLGRNDTPYKISTRKLDNFGDTIADNRTLFGTVTGVSSSKSFVTKQPDLVSYISPTMGNVILSAAYLNLSENAAAAAAPKDRAASLAAMYDDGTFYGSLAYETHKLDSVRLGGRENAWAIAGAYTMNDFKIGAAYERTSDTLGGAAAPAACAGLAVGADCLGHSAWYVSAIYSFGSNALKAAYSSAGSLAGRANTGADHLSFGLDHRLSKRTTLYALYTRLSNDSAANYGLAGAAWSSGVTPSVGAGAAPSALSFGMKHTF